MHADTQVRRPACIKQEWNDFHRPRVTGRKLIDRKCKFSQVYPPEVLFVIRSLRPFTDALRKGVLLYDQEETKMKKKQTGKQLSLILCMVLVLSMAMVTSGCNGGQKAAADTTKEQQGAVDGSVLGEGKTQFTFTVVDKEGTETAFEIHTDKETVGEALLELGLIAGDESEYGLYVKTVNGITADYDQDGVYWAFYVNGEYAQSGVDSTKITEGDSYSFKVE